MTDRRTPDEPTDDELAALDELLADASVWAEPDAADEEAIVAAILAEASDGPPVQLRDVSAQPDGSAFTGPSDAEPTGAVSTSGGDAEVVALRPRRSWGTAVLGAAAGVLLALVGVATITTLADREPDEVAITLEGTDNAPGASAEARIVALDAGTRIELDVSGLPPAPPGTYYEAWLRESPEVGVSAGTFHMRGGDDSIELWSGVVLQDYPLVTVTIQDEAEPESSGVVVLRALFEGG
ncbi:MAG: anti-sigma factor [Actinomycetota bacterium]